MSDFTSFATISHLLHGWDHLGVQLSPNGMVLIGRVPHRAPEAWLHQVFAPATQEQLDILDSLPIPVYPEYLSLCAQANGLHLFSGHLSIYGVRSSYARTGEARRQPFAIRLPNTLERIPEAPRDALFVGTNPFKGSRFALLGNSGEVVESELNRFSVLRHWRSLSEMLLHEVERLASRCDSQGYILE